MLIVLGGLPGVGKTTIARELARIIGAVHLGIDSIEIAIRESGVTVVSVDDAGYRVAYAVAEDNLRIGWTVVADSVNPWSLTRNAWQDVAKRAAVTAVEVEITCSDTQEHRRRVERRLAETPGMRGPTWEQVASHDYHPWNREHVVIDTAGLTLDQIVARLRDVVPTNA